MDGEWKNGDWKRSQAGSSETRKKIAKFNAFAPKTFSVRLS
jgi:hypothetical protein